MKTLLETLTAGAAYLGKHGVPEARLNMEHLLAHVLECRRLDLYLRFNDPVSDADLEALRPLTRRRAEGTPLQHLLGTVEFAGLELVSDHRALIPRPETEHLVQHLLETSSPPPAEVLDVGCGSGCIGLSLAHHWNEAGSRVTLADVSEEALDLTRLNASRLGLDAVRIVRSDLLDRIDGSFDLIVSNPPYIPSGEIPSLSREVRQDPHLALDGGADGLDLVRRLLPEAMQHLKPSGKLALELGHDQADAVQALAQALDFRDIEVLPDWAGVRRFVLATAPAPSPLPPTSIN